MDKISRQTALSSRSRGGRGDAHPSGSDVGLGIVPVNVRKKQMKNTTPTWQLISDVMMKSAMVRITIMRQDKREKE